MEKKVRKAVRTFLIKDNKVIAIKYKTHDPGFYDIPGGGIEEGEKPEDTSIREFREETGLNIIKQHHIGHCINEYSERIFDFDIFVVDEYTGDIKDFEENDTLWIDKDELISQEKKLATIELLKYLKDGMELKIYCDNNHKALKIEEK